MVIGQSVIAFIKSPLSPFSIMRALNKLAKLTRGMAVEIKVQSDSKFQTQEWIHL